MSPGFLSYILYSYLHVIFASVKVLEYYYKGVHYKTVNEESGMFRKNIINTIISVGLDIDDFIIGSGARSKGSEIHYRPKKNNVNDYQRKKYSIQYCEDIIAVWEIGKRIDKHASIDLVWEGKCWKDVEDLQVKEIGIKDDDESTAVAVMPSTSFEPYLRLAFNKQDDEKYYSNRIEGDRIQIFTTRYERNPDLRKKAIEIHGLRCQVCDLSFAEMYGEIGEGFIEVHHIKPISEGPREVNPETDMICLCSNCHRMIHRKRDQVITVEELIRMIRTDK